MNHTIQAPQICLNISSEEHKEGIKEASRKARMEVINNLEQESREKLKKQEFQVYTRQKKLNQPLSPNPTVAQTRHPPMNILLPKNPPKTERVDLNFDFEGALSKLHVTIPLREIINVPSVKEIFDNFFKGLDGPMDPPIMLQDYPFRVQYDEHPPFFMTLLMNNKCLNNCMLDLGAGANMMSLKVMQQLGLKVTRPYRSVSGFDSRSIPTHGVIENVEVFLGRYLERVIHIGIVVVYVLDVWGMLLSKKFVAMLGGNLEMDLTYINVHMKDGTISHLPNVPMTKIHVQEISDHIKANKAHEQIIEGLPEFSPDGMPFAKEKYFVQIQWPKREDYQQLLDKDKDNKFGVVRLLNKGEDNVLIHPSQQEVFTAESHPPPFAQYTRVVQETTKFKTREYKEGDIVWMWDMKKGELTNVKGNVQFWLGPFIIGRKLVNDAYYLSTLEGRRRPLPVSGHLLKPHQWTET
jgi:hypothetical protein